MQRKIKITEGQIKMAVANAVNKILKEMKTSYGLEYEVLPPSEINRFEGYDKVIAQNQISNYGCIIINKAYGDPIDNEYDIEEIIPNIKKGTLKEEENRHFELISELSLEQASDSNILKYYEAVSNSVKQAKYDKAFNYMLKWMKWDKSPYHMVSPNNTKFVKELAPNEKIIANKGNMVLSVSQEEKGNIFRIYMTI